MPARKDASSSGRRRLGRGLTSLISTPVPVKDQAEDPGPAPPPKTASPAGRAPEGGVRFLSITQVQANPDQPRRHFDEEALEALAASIRTAGLMQPIVVRPVGDAFQLVVGERRWRAAQRIGLEKVPAIVREIDDQAAAEWALIENIQREDLNPLERAEAFRRLIDDFELTHQDVAERVGLNRSSVTNLLRLHELDEPTKEEVRAGRLSLAAAKILLSITNLEARKHLARLAVREGWSVRSLERRAASLAAPPRKQRAAATTATKPHRHDLERRLSDHLGTRVQIRPGRQKGSGRLVIDFFSLDQFDGLMERLGFKPADL